MIGCGAFRQSLRLMLGAEVLGYLPLHNDRCRILHSVGWVMNLALIRTGRTARTERISFRLVL